VHVLVSDAWRDSFPDAHVGVLCVQNAAVNLDTPAFEQRLVQLAQELRARYAGMDRASLAQLPAVRPYWQHYRAFGQTYHVLRQLESVVVKGRPIQSPGGALVSAMFAAELDTLLLTAGHDLECLVEPLVIDASRDGDHFIGIGGQEQVLKAGDMLMRDAQGIISAVLNGPDQRTRLSASTHQALFVSYAPAGIQTAAVREHLEHIGALVRLAAPGAEVGAAAIYPQPNVL
jgi:DNA/RNA-binding domain of Phe-tRNA-synthetase-like protein